MWRNLRLLTKYASKFHRFAAGIKSLYPKVIFLSRVNCSIGSGGLLPMVLKTANKQFTQIAPSLLNHSMLEGHLPDAWKENLIVIEP